MDTFVTISALIASASGLVAGFTLHKLVDKVKHSKNITLTKPSTGKSITVTREYNRENSKKLKEFMK